MVSPYLMHRRKAFRASSNPLRTGLIAWYRMDESSGNALDAHTGGYHLTQSGTVSSVAGRVGNARNGFTTSNFFSSSNSVFNFGNRTFYIACWYRSTSASFSENSSILGKWNPSTNDRSYLLYVDQNNSNRISLLVSSDGTFTPGGVNLASSTTVAANTWYFVEAYHDAASDQIGIAINGGSFTTLSHSSGVFSTSVAFAVGRNNVGQSLASNPLTNGIVDEVALWSRILTTDERAELYNGGSGLAYPG